MTSSTTAFSLSCLITSFDTRGAKAMSIAFMRILLPAPVSPVITFKPLSKLAVNSSIKM